MAANVKAVNQAPVGFILFMCWIGALVYFVGKVDGFWNIIVAFFQSLVWPAFLIYRAFELMNI